jgi:hypothetical protein
VPALRSAILTLALATVAPLPAAAQWTRVTEIPITNVFSVLVKGDTITAGVDTAAYVSTNAGATWKKTARVAAGVTSVERVRVHNGRLYAGTFGQGVFVSTNLGDTWTNHNQGLSGGIANSHLFTADMMVHGDSLYLATSGAGPYVRRLSGVGTTWTHYGNVFEPNQSSNMNAITVGGARLFASAGGNGTVFFRDPGQPDWTLSWLSNVGIVAGLGALTAIHTGSNWIVGSNVGVFHSPLGQSPWAFSDVGLGTLFSVSFAMRGATVFGMFGTGAGSTYMFSKDGGVTWPFIEDQPFVFTFNIATHGNTLYAARFDGLWRRSIENVSVPEPRRPAALNFAIVGAQPTRDDVRFHFDLPEAGPASIDFFDVSGRRAGPRLEGSWPAGSNEVSGSVRGLAPGIYLVRLTAASRSETVRLVRVL